jgi:hypothetical protein
MNHTCVYFIAGDSYSNLPEIRSAGIIDAHLVIHGGGVTPPSQFVKDCIAAGLSPICNNGNDGGAGWDGSASYYPNLFNMGYHAAGGESEQANEIDAIMNSGIFLDYGGEGTGGGTNDDVWKETHTAPVHGGGCAGYYETYDGSDNFWGWDVVGSGMKDAKAHGVKEIGIMIGSWMLDHSTVQDYITLAQTMESNGITCAGFGVWSGYNNNMNNVYNEFASWYQQLMAIWPPTSITMKNRFSGPTPTPTPTPAPVAADGSNPAVTYLNGVKYSFARGLSNALYYLTDGATKWLSLGGTLTSGVAAETVGNEIYIFGRGADKKTTYYRTLTKEWTSIGGIATSSPGLTLDSNGKTLLVEVRGGDKAVWYRTLDTTTGAVSPEWLSLGGVLN